MKIGHWESEYQTLRRSIQTSQFKVTAHSKSVGVAINHVLISQVVLSLCGLKRPENLKSLRFFCEELSGIATLGFRSREDAEKFRTQLLLMRGLYLPGKPQKINPRQKQAEKEFAEHREKTMRLSAMIPYPLLDSQAFRDLTYGPAIKVLLWCFEKKEFVRSPGKRGKKGRWTVLNNPFSFKYDEAQIRGLTNNQFAKALKELVQRGFLDLITLGSGLEHDYSEFRLSDRWRNWGTPQFQSIGFPAAAPFGFRRGKQKDVSM